jgi:hypothetical protein
LDTFEKTGSAMQTTKIFREQGLRFPRRIRAGLSNGELHWAQASHSRIIQVLHNPRYAGAFVYGRVRTRLLPDGKHSTIRVPQSDWQFVIPGINAECIRASYQRYLESNAG